ncbi:MAG: hypothetical protein N2561_02495 [Bacteroidetes bacterium]|nr:hypothetical protein [Rhodothermia bacterium]MCS7154672.1 hypothetical protein [Bacteroidota bacterium]MCX7906389.1 hypothetical protein [Bacteroidota bacterium]MDW8137465.1 TIGR02530 family flagellar biosynthesis protein [Bacteroidota bacterium]MDW8285581.1 TIGR02530 family flagellar biosynthesis protein [Bacteroidota bacterium]
MQVQELLRRVDPGALSGSGVRSPTPQTVPGAQSAPPFAELLRRAMESPPGTGVRFSAHALERLSERDIRLSPGELELLGRALDRLAQKGAQDSLVVHPRAAFLVNVPNRTVITAVDLDQMRERVFTQIDSALIL